MIGRYEFDTLWIWVYDFDMVLLCFWYDLGYGVGIFGMFWMWFWYGLDMVYMVLIWFGNEAPFSGFLTGWLQERKRKQPWDSLLVDFSRVFVLLIWFCCCFDMVLIRFWYGFDMVLIRFWIWFGWVGFKSQVWPASRIITETISKSYLKPYQHHKCKTMPETIHNNKSYLKRITIIKKNILKNFHPRDFGCYKARYNNVLI